MTAAYSIYWQRRTIPIAFAASRATNPKMLQSVTGREERQGGEAGRRALIEDASP
jgi:hypothetical protein